MKIFPSGVFFINPPDGTMVSTTTKHCKWCPSRPVYYSELETHFGQLSVVLVYLNLSTIETLEKIYQ